MKSRRGSCWALLIALTIVLAGPAYAQDSGNPNVVLVYMDNFGYGEPAQRA
jgi:hypothetical protein